MLYGIQGAVSVTRTDPTTKTCLRSYSFYGSSPGNMCCHDDNRSYQEAFVYLVCICLDIHVKEVRIGRIDQPLRHGKRLIRPSLSLLSILLLLVVVLAACCSSSMARVLHGIDSTTHRFAAGSPTRDDS